MRATDKGLQFTQEMDVVTFSINDIGDVRINNQESLLRDSDRSRKFIIENRDNIRDFGEWLTKLSFEQPEEPIQSSFETYTVSQNQWVAAVSVTHPERGNQLSELFANGEAEIGSDTIEDLNVLINSVSELIGRSTRNLTRVESEAFAYPFGIPEGMTPIVLATQTYVELQLQFDELFIHSSIPYESARQL